MLLLKPLSGGLFPFPRLFPLSFQPVVVGRLLDAELLVEVVVGDRQVELPGDLREDIDLRRGVYLLLLRETEVPPGRVDAHAGENIGHVVIEHIEEIPLVSLGHLVLHLFVDSTQSLRAVFRGFGRQRIAEDKFGNLVVAPLAEPFVHIGRTGLVAGFYKIEFGVLVVEELCEASDIRGVLYRPLAGLLVVGVIDILLYGHTEELGELRPVAGGVPFVDDPRRRLRQQPQVVGTADEQQVGIILPRQADDVRLVTEDNPPYRIHMLAGDKVVVHPFPLPVELAEGKAPELGVDDVADQPVEPRGTNLLVHRVVRLAVPAELDVGAEHGVLPFLDDAGEVRVHENVGIQVI